MRLQLFLLFTLIIALSVSTSWALAVRTTDTQFEVLISDNNQRQAEYYAPLLIAEYEKLGSWEAVQEEFDVQGELQRDTGRLSMMDSGVALAPYLDQWLGIVEVAAGDFAFNFDIYTLPENAFENNGIDISVHGRGNRIRGERGPRLMNIHPPDMLEGIVEQFEHEFFLGDFLPNISGMPPIVERAIPFENATIVIEPSFASWLVASARVIDQRVIVIDETGTVAVDSETALLGQKVDTSFTEGGAILESNGEHLGTFLITSQDGVYSVEQTSFLESVRQGLLYGGIISAGLAAILALLTAHQLTRPIRLLTAATSRIQAGEWGYQVESQGRHEIGQLGRAFNQMSRHLDEQRRLRVRLVDDLAHELNTPLSLMRLELQGMVDGFQTPEEAAEHINHELDEVSELVSDLIFLASRDTAPPPHMAWLNLNTLVANTVRRFEASTNGQVSLIADLADDLPLLYADADLVQRAISNLIANALRHTPQGNITIRTKQHDNSLEVGIQDTGQGIPTEHLPHIFERFYRADDSRSRKSGGSGLGLAIVKQIMDQHQGTVRVESVPGEGSTFRLCWPKNSVQPAPNIQ